MASLIEDVLSIESRANDIIIKAHADAKNLEKSAQAEIDRAVAEIEARTAQRVEAYRRDAEEKQKAALAAEKADLACRTSVLERMDPAHIERMAGLVVAEFRRR